jgi:thiol-disulfide isomerase/thioredoxin
MKPNALLSALVLSAGLLPAQGVFTNADKPGASTCPRLMKDKTALEYSSQYGVNSANASAKLYHQEGNWFIPQGERKDVSPFAAYDERSHGTSLASLKGKVVLVGLWSVHCDPSAKMLMEFASLYPKRAQYGFDILAVNFDENQQDGGGIEGGWRAINKFMIKNRQFFEVSHMPVYTPGLGKEGPANFMDMVWSVPVLFVVDREGKLAQIHIGYKDGFVGEALKRALMERPAPQPAPVPPAPAPAPAKSSH